METQREAIQVNPAPNATPSTSSPAEPVPGRSPEIQRANALMTRYAGGDDAAFNELYRWLAPRLYRHCQSLCGPSDAEELLQEVFLKIHRARSTFIDSGSVLAWAFTIARTTHLDIIRYRRRRPETTMDRNYLDRYSAHDAGRPDNLYAQYELHTELAREIELLTDGLRKAYVLVRLDGASCADAGAVLGVSTDAIKQRVCRASAALKCHLEELLNAA